MTNRSGEIRNIYIKVSELTKLLFIYPEGLGPKEFTVENLPGIGEIVYRLEDHGKIQCGERVNESNYRVKNPVDEKGWHQHISANVAGLKVGEPFKNKVGDIQVPVKLLTDERDNSIKETIKKYLVEEKGACPLAVNFQN